MEKSSFPGPFRSWVPTITGQLSFSVIGHTDWPRSCIVRSSIPAKGKAVIIQERYCDDFVLPILGKSDVLRDLAFNILGRLFRGGKTSGRHHFICCVENSVRCGTDISAINGKIYPIISSKIGRAVAKDLQNRAGSKNADGSIESLLNSVTSNAPGVSPIVCSFTLERNGLTKISVEKAGSVPEFKNVTVSDVELYCEQAFFFLRDIVHNHQHHDSATDTIIRLHSEEDDWQKQIYFDLFRSAIRFKRVRTSDNIINAGGVLAYAETYNDNVVPEIDLPKYAVRNTLNSLSAARSELEHTFQRRSNYLSFLQAAIFGLVGLLLSVVAIAAFAEPDVKKTIIPAEIVVQLAKLMAAQPIATLLTGSLFSYAVVRMIGMRRPERRSSFQDFQRLVHGQKKIRFSLIVYLSALVASAFTIYALTHVFLP